MLLKQFIKEIEEKVGEKFDISNTRHFMMLNGKIERLNKNKLRKLSMIEKIMKSENWEDEIFDSSTHFIVTKRGNK